MPLASLYVATFEEAVYVLHAFHKKTRKTARRELDIGRQRFRAVIEMRQKRP
jgi:phage-related protein